MQLMDNQEHPFQVDPNRDVLDEQLHLTPEGQQDLKQRRWNDAALMVEGFRDGLGLKVDEGIKETVVALIVSGFKTRQSCEGHLNRAIAAPWVDIQVEGTEELQSQVNQAFNDAEAAERAGKSNDELDELFSRANTLHKEAQRPMLKEASRVMELLNVFYSNRQVSNDRRLTINPFGSFFRIESEGSFLQDIANDQTKNEKLQEYQEEMRTFTAFLKERYFS